MGFPLKKSALLYIPLGVLFIAGSAVAAPVVSEVLPSQESDFSSGDTITITGKGFGTKDQAAPVLFDFVGHAYENGTLNEHQASFDDMEPVKRPDKDPNTLWEKPSVTNESGNASPLVTFSRDSRHDESDAHYYFTGNNGFVGWPTAYGGSDTPVDNQKLYVSWWLKMAFDPSSYYSIPMSSDSADFVMGGRDALGEELLLEGEAVAQVIGADPIDANYTSTGSEDRLHIVLYTDNDRLFGRTLTGAQSKEKITFPEAGSVRDSLGPGSNKFIRIWEDPRGKKGIRFSWTQMHLTVSDEVIWESADLKPGKWNFMEMAIDTGSGEFTAKVNGDVLTTFQASPNDLNANGELSPTIALLGFNGKNQTLQVTEFDDIYMDKTFQRVVVADAPKLSEATSFELQRPVKWNSSEIKVSLNLGAFKSSKGLYVFVFDGAGQHNETGIPLCNECQSAPGQPTITDIEEAN